MLPKLATLFWKHIIRLSVLRRSFTSAVTSASNCHQLMSSECMHVVRFSLNVGFNVQTQRQFGPRPGCLPTSRVKPQGRTLTQFSSRSLRSCCRYITSGQLLADEPIYHSLVWCMINRSKCIFCNVRRNGWHLFFYHVLCNTLVNNEITMF